MTPPGTPQPSRTGADRPALGEVGLFTNPVRVEPQGSGMITGVPTTFTPERLASTPRALPKETGEVHWPTIVLLRRRASDQITSRLRYLESSGNPVSVENRDTVADEIIRQVVHEHANELNVEGAALWSLETEEAHVRALANAIFGFGRLQPLFEIPEAENIEIHGHDSVVVQHSDGTRHSHPPVADSDEELVEAVRFLGQQSSPSRPFDDAHPTMTLALGDRFRLHAMGFGLSFRPSITIRQHRLVAVDLPGLVRTGLMPEMVGRYLHAAVVARRSIVISGDQGAGKTTLLRALIAAIPSTERFGTIETDYELLTHLQPGRENMVALQARVGLGERQDGRILGEFTVADLLPEALRQNLSRIVVGEVRGVEAAAMFEAMASGAGTLSTTHSHSAAATMDRLAMRVAQGGAMSLADAYRQIAHNIDFLVHLELSDQTWAGGARVRHIAEVRQLTGALESDRPVTHLCYRSKGPSDPAPFFQPDPVTSRELAVHAAAWGS